jgi:hypothetical protein
MIIQERICLVIDNFIFVAKHANSFTFVGGTNNNPKYKPGETCMNEIEEEFGMRIVSKLPKIISYYRSNNTLHILFYLAVSKSDIEFTRASHVWEISNFTLIPLNKSEDPKKIAEWLIENITSKNPCSQYIEISGNEITPLENLPKKLQNDKNIFMDNKKYYVKLITYPKLTEDEKGFLKVINMQVNGFDDDIFVFNEDTLCRLSYIPYHQFMYLQIATNSIVQIDGKTYKSDSTYDKIENIDDFKKSLIEEEKLPQNIEATLKSIVSTIKKTLSEFGFKDVINTSFFYLDKESYCCKRDVYSMFDDIDDFDYIKPIKKLAEYYAGSEPNYYETVVQKYDTKLANPLYIYDFDYELDEILLQYTKCINNMSVMITWPVSNISDIKKTKFYSELKSNGDIHAIKEIVISQKQLQGIIHQVYYDKGVFKRFEAVQNKAERCGKRDNNRIFVIFYKSRDVKTITGTDAPFKVAMRKLLKESSGNKQDLKDNMFLHITDNHLEAIELAKIFCNKNSMRMLQYQRLDRLLKHNFWKSLVFFMTFKSWLYSNIAPIDQIRFMLFSSSVLFTLGLRNMNDLDLLVHYLPTGEKTKTENFFDKIYVHLENEKTKFPFIVDGASIKGRTGWCTEDNCSKKYLVEWFEKEWPELFGAKSMDDIILNPRFHYYYFGMKIVSLTGDIKRRIQRSRPAAYADLFAIKKFVFDKLEIPKIPDGYWKNHVYYQFTEKEKNDLAKKTVYYLKARYHIDMKENDVKKILI